MENFKQKKLRDYLNSKWQNAKCPICSEPLQTVEATVLELREFNDGNLVVGGPSGGVLPVIPIICSNCGNTVLLNALSTGMLKD